ncbi:hypothetical protein STEG23_027258 [Scotinomys teguina]
MTSSSLESPAEMKGEQQDSSTFEMLHLEKGEHRLPSGLHHIGKVNSKQSSSEQQRPDCFQDYKKSGVSSGQTAGDMWELLTTTEDSRLDLLST